METQETGIFSVSNEVNHVENHYLLHVKRDHREVLDGALNTGVASRTGWLYTLFVGWLHTRFVGITTGCSIIVFLAPTVMAPPW